MSRPFAALVVLCSTVALPAAAGQPPASKLPACAPGWKLEVVAAAPDIRHPSVVCCAPDGRVFVAEDPMDISTKSASEQLGRILCLHPGGKTTVFADKLYAVFGMQYLDGKLYVLHNPKFSRFTDDDGVGTDRLDLIESTNPKPWALDWNDHVPANFRLGMDGYLYMAVGDKGVYGAVGRDGKRVDLHGGGILRLKPDGTALEVYCTGVRNIMDVVPNAEDEWFTYDNTDEQQWMGRLSHMADGGFYGYPYDFRPRRPYTLWMMFDYGGGAATGAECYTADALPATHRGNLFLADFGKRQVMRVPIARAGGTFVPGPKQDLFLDPPGDFRPVGIAFHPDGKALYICDWNHTDSKDKVVCGRLFKLTYTGDSPAPAAKPTWYLPAAMGRPFEATTDELVRGLAHPDRAVRLVAQRRLGERGKEAAGPLAKVVADPAAVPHARWHALWALDVAAPDEATRAALALLADKDNSVRRQAARLLGTRRAAGAVGPLGGMLTDPDASIRFWAATALGRIGSAEPVPALVAALAQDDLYARYAAFTALNRIGRADPGAWAAVARGLADPNPVVREGTAFALRETYDEKLVGVLAGLAGDAAAPVEARTTVLGLLGSVYRKLPGWTGGWWAYHPVNGPPPVKSAEWAGSRAVQAALRDALRAADPVVRRAAVAAVREARDAGAAPALRDLYRAEADGGVAREILATLGALKDKESGGLVRAILDAADKHPGLVATAVAAGEQIGGPEVAAGLRGFVGSAPADKALLARAVAALGVVKDVSAVPLLKETAARPDAEVRRAAAAALARVGGPAARDALVELVGHPKAEVRRDAIAALGEVKATAAVPRLLEAYADPDTRAAALQALARIPDARAADAYLDGLGDKDVQVREQCRQAIAAIRRAALPRAEARADTLSATALTLLRQVYANDATARKGKVFTAGKVATAAEYLAFATDTAGDPARGAKLFADASRLACAKCHKVNGRGGEIGPDLSTIGAQFDRAQLAEAVLFPSKVIREGYHQVTVTTVDGRSVAGLVRAESNDTLTLRDADGKDHTVKADEIEKRAGSRVSLMPEGLHAGIDLQEFADLIAYLHGLRPPK